MAEKKLSKREQKAEAFKKRAKKPQFTDDMAVPQSDEIVEAPAVEEVVQKPQAEKRKAEAISVPVEGSTEEPHKKKNRRSKKSSNLQPGSRYIVFVGNLPYATTKEEIEKHFENVEGIKSVRLLTDKATGKPKGFAFMEFENSKDLNVSIEKVKEMKK